MLTATAPDEPRKLTKPRRLAFRELEKRHWKADDSEKLKFIKAIAQLAKDEDIEAHSFSAADILGLPLSFAVAQRTRQGGTLDLIGIYRDALELCI